MNFCTSLPEKQDEKIFEAASDNFFRVDFLLSSNGFKPRRLGRDITDDR